MMLPGDGPLPRLASACPSELLVDRSLARTDRRICEPGVGRAHSRWPALTAHQSNVSKLRDDTMSGVHRRTKSADAAPRTDPKAHGIGLDAEALVDARQLEAVVAASYGNKTCQRPNGHAEKPRVSPPPRGHALKKQIALHVDELELVNVIKRSTVSVKFFELIYVDMLNIPSVLAS
jgi:hypothetical protein